MIFRKRLDLFFALIVFSISLKAQDTATNPIKPNKYFFKSVLLDTRDVFIAPAHWHKNQWLMAGSVCATTGALIVYDKDINRFMQRNRTPLTDSLSKFAFEPIGRGLYSFPVLGLFGLHHAITGNERSGRVFYLGTKSAALSGLLVTILKYSFQRHRPYQDVPSDPNQWEFYGGKMKYRSFPSGHTITAFSIATIIATEYSDKWYVPVICYALASTVAYSRMNDNKHWASDVFMGAALGFSISKMIYYRNNWNIKLRKKYSPLVYRIDNL